MKIILLKDIARVGEAGEIKDVSPSFARNVLLKNQQAQMATLENLSQLKAKQAKFDKEHATNKSKLDKLYQKINSLKIVIKEKANEQGKLFAGIDKKRIAQTLKEDKDIEIDPNIIKLKGHLKELGSQKIEFALNNNLTGEFDLEIKKL